MDLVQGARFIGATSNVVGGYAILGSTASLNVANSVLSVVEGLTGADFNPQRRKLDKRHKMLVHSVEARSEKQIKDEKKPDSLLTRYIRQRVLVAGRRMAMSAAGFIFRNLWRLAGYGTRFLGVALRLGARVAIQGLFFLGRSLLMCNPYVLAAVAVVGISYAGYKWYKANQAADGPEDTPKVEPPKDVPTKAEEKRHADVVVQRALKTAAPVAGQSRAPDQPTVPYSAGESALSAKQMGIRGLRNNNPGNLQFVGQAGATKEVLPSGAKGRFARFSSQAAGLYAMATQVQRDMAGKNKTFPGVRNTLKSLIRVYAPGCDNNNEVAYVNTLSRYTGFKGDQIIDPTDETSMVNLMRGIIQMENGSNPYSDQQIRTAARKGIGYRARGFKTDPADNEAFVKHSEEKKAEEIKKTEVTTKKAEEVDKKKSYSEVVATKPQEKEIVKLMATIPFVGGPISTSQDFSLPVNSPVSSSYKPARTLTVNGKQVTKDHKGTDFATPVGTPIKAAHDGVVVRADNNDSGGYGNLVVIKGDKYYSWYAHLNSYKVGVGTKVKRGEVIGLSGGKKGAPGAGSSQGPHLHFAISTNYALGKGMVSYIPPQSVIAGIPTERGKNTEAQETLAAANSPQSVGGKGGAPMPMNTASNKSGDTLYTRDGSKILRMTT